jgi:O-antigen/teichoic acid export membrane protein
MSITKRIAFGAAASWFSRGVTILMGLVLMPVLFRHLPKEELGVWLLLGQSWAALGIFDLGFGATLTRRIAFAKGKSGSDPVAELTDETLREIADLVATGKRVYRALAVFAFVFSLGAGFFYLRTLHLGAVPFSQVWLAWSVICLSQALGVWANVWNCILLGVGYVGWDAVLGSLASALTLLAQIIVVLLGGGLVSLAVAAAAGALTQRFLMLGFARRRRPEIFTIHGQWKFALVKSMTPLALRAWATALGLTLALNTDQLFIGKIVGAAELPPFRAAYLILLNLNMLAVTVAGSSAVFISHLWQAGEVSQVHHIVTRNLKLGLGLMACGGACVLGLGQRLFDLWLGTGNFVGYPVLIIFFVLLFLEAQCFIVTTSSRATEDEAFALWAIAAGALKVVLSTVLGLRFGLLGIALGTLLAQLATNHWFMVFRGLRRLRMSLRQHVKQVLLPVGVLFVVTIGAVWLVVRVLSGFPLLLVVGAGCVMSGTLLLIALWALVLEADQRRRLVAHFGFSSTKT